MYSKKTFKGFVGDNTAPNRFTAWGTLSEQAPKQGWYPVMWNNEVTEYKNKNENLFNRVQLPNNKFGYISAIGGNQNGVFDLVVKDDKGKVITPLLQKVRPEQIDAYFRSPTNVVAGRANSITAGTNQDRYLPDGSYVALR